MRKRLLAVIVVLWCVSSSWAQLKITGAVKEVEGYVELSIDTKASIIWKVIPEPVKKTTFTNGTKFIFAGIPGIVYNVDATIIDWDKRTVDQLSESITFKPLGPGPVPPIPPPAPDDPLVVKFKDAIRADPDKTVIPKFLDLYKRTFEVNGIIDKARNYGEMEDLIRAEAARLGISGKAIPYQTEAANYLKTQIQWKQASETPVDKPLAKRAYTKVHDSLDLALRSTK